MSERFGITFGAMAPSLKDQLREQGRKCDGKSLSHLQQDADAITRLVIRGHLTDGEARKARTRLLKRINEEPRRG